MEVGRTSQQRHPLNVEQEPQGFFPGGRRWSYQETRHAAIQQQPTRARSYGEFASQVRHCPRFTPCIFLVCSAVLFAEFYYNGQGVAMSSAPTEACYYKFALGDHVLCAASLSVNPLFGPSSDVLLTMGSVMGVKVIDEGEKWRLLTCMFLHGGLIHFICNMLALLQIGSELERTHGFFRVALVYMSSGLVGAMASAAFTPNVSSVGASGAIFGLLGGLLGDVIQNWGLYNSPCRTLLSLVFNISIQFLLGTMPMLDNMAHFFGFLMGFTTAMGLLIRERHTSSGRVLGVKFHHRCTQLVAFGCSVFLAGAGLAIIYGEKGAKELCPWCDRISCQPFPWGCEAKSCWWQCPSASQGQIGDA
eukprot:TRINITY_DN84184_c0_g1_i1.p1 TRINITY_DN84184_c0_g1~~TRINITY_DN84184_c0_g1_i1.p1  ORF type:complete len:361 (-),score=45.69 TRINITY_DN84184_c0_g1_i1:199-1281(-)